MSANLTIRENGTAEMFSGNNMVPWHGLGSVVKGTVTAEEAIVLAQMNWTVSKQPIFVNGTEVKEWKATVRDDNKYPLGIVTDRYHIINNSEAFSFFDNIVGEGQAVYETAGSLNGGKKIWIMAKLPESVFLSPEDKHDKWVMLCTAHDGSHAVWMQLVSTRVVCQNTLSAALAGATNQIKIRHSKNYEAKKEQAQQVLDIANGYFGNLSAVMAKLANEKCSLEQAETFTRQLVKTEDENDVPTRTKNIREAIVTLFQRGTGNKGETRYDYLNGVTEFVDHARSTRVSKGKEEGESRFESVMLGSGLRMKQDAVDLLTADLAN